MKADRSRDIKLTLATDTRRSASIGEESKWLQTQGQLMYPLGAGQPRFAHAGCWVYFIRNGAVVARAIARDFISEAGARRISYSGARSVAPTREVVIDELGEAITPLPHKGFQGFRYVADSERSAFESAFAAEA